MDCKIYEGRGKSSSSILLSSATVLIQFYYISTAVLIKFSYSSPIVLRKQWNDFLTVTICGLV